MESFNDLTKDVERLTNPKSPIYINIAEIVRIADKNKLGKKVIQKHARQYLKTVDKNN